MSPIWFEIMALFIPISVIALALRFLARQNLKIHSPIGIGTILSTTLSMLGKRWWLLVAGIPALAGLQIGYILLRQQIYANGYSAVDEWQHWALNAMFWLPPALWVVLAFFWLRSLAIAPGRSRLMGFLNVFWRMAAIVAICGIAMGLALFGALELLRGLSYEFFLRVPQETLGRATMALQYSIVLTIIAPFFLSLPAANEADPNAELREKRPVTYRGLLLPGLLAGILVFMLADMVLQQTVFGSNGALSYATTAQRPQDLGLMREIAGRGILSSIYASCAIAWTCTYATAVYQALVDQRARVDPKVFS
ncbi:hypothetical protein HXX25_06035 [Hyphobacterium sp. CCMP332]|nr:hypothetical protein HXX25_06035 [Hyphobacterium sp. CCMP332]